MISNHPGLSSVNSCILQRKLIAPIDADIVRYAHSSLQGFTNKNCGPAFSRAQLGQLVVSLLEMTYAVHSKGLVGRKHSDEGFPLLRLSSRNFRFLKISNEFIRDDYARVSDFTSYKVHLDLKPGNVMLTKQNELKVIDFDGALRADSVLNPDGSQLAFTPA